jgi:hypothetical protein
MNAALAAKLAKRCDRLADILETDIAKGLLDKSFKTVTRQGYEYFSDEEAAHPKKIADLLDRLDIADRLRARAAAFRKQVDSDAKGGGA